MTKRIHTGLAERVPHFSMERGFYKPDKREKTALAALPIAIKILEADLSGVLKSYIYLADELSGHAAVSQEDFKVAEKEINKIERDLDCLKRTVSYIKKKIREERD